MKAEADISGKKSEKGNRGGLEGHLTPDLRSVFYPMSKPIKTSGY